MPRSSTLTDESTAASASDDEKGAREDLEAVLRRDPDNAGGLELRAHLAVAGQDLAAAIKTGMVEMAEVHGPVRFEATGFAQFDPH
mgnify:CR=1 FL=1